MMNFIATVICRHWWVGCVGVGVGGARIAFAELQLAKGGGRCSGEEKQWGKEEEKEEEEEEKKEEKEKQEVWLCDAAV